jgi:hypothetical protein
MFNVVAIRELEVWGDDTPIGGEPPAPPPPGGTPPPADPTYVYAESRHIFNINYQSSSSQTDACNIPLVVEGTGLDEEEGPDIITTETTPPFVINTTPINGASNTLVNTTVLIEMSEQIDITTVTSSTVIISPSVAATRSLTGATSNIINLNPDADLANSTTYTITVKGGTIGVKDIIGNPLSSDHIFSFSTIAAADTTPPTILSKTPDSGATGVSRSANIVITFSEPMMASRVTDSEIDLWQTSVGSGTMIPRTVILSGDGTVATVNPNSDLAGSTQYTCRVRGGTAPSVADLAGNTMADPDVQWDFTTAAPTYTVIYDYSLNGDSWTDLNHDPYNGSGLRLQSSSTLSPYPLINKKPKAVLVLMRREGSPGGTLTCKIRRWNGSGVPMTNIATIGTMNANDVTTSADGQLYYFENPTLDHPMEIDDCIMISSSHGSSSAYIQVRRTDTDDWDKGILVRIEAADNDGATDTGRDWVAKIYE